MLIEDDAQATAKSPGREAHSDRGPKEEAEHENQGEPSSVRPVAIKPAISGHTAAAKRQSIDKLVPDSWQKCELATC